MKFNELLDIECTNEETCENIYESKVNIPWVDKYRPTKLAEIVHQEEIVKMLKKTLETGNLPHLLLYGSSGTGKCVSLETPIVLFNGKIKIARNIKINDLLMGDDNTPRTVLSTTIGKDTMYKIIQKNGNDYIVNSEHILSLKLSSPFIKVWSDKEKRYKLRWFENHVIKQQLFPVQQKNNSKEDIHKVLQIFQESLMQNNKVNKKGDICDISVKQYLKKNRIWKYSYKGFKCGRINCWKEKKVELDPYILGYWLSNGSKDKILIKVDDYKIIDYFKKSIAKNNLILKQTKCEMIKNNYYSITFGVKYKSKTPNHFENYLKKYELLYEKYVPNDYKINNVATRLQLLAGFLDADGCLNKYNYFQFTQKSERLFNDIIFIARSLGLNVSTGKSKKIDGEIYYKAKIYINKIEDIPTKINRQVFKIYDFSRDSVVTEIKVQKLNTGDYFGFELDGNGRFLLGDFTVTHNTSIILAIAMELFGPKRIKDRIIELNASDERGIGVVRNKIVTFAKTAIGTNDPKYPCPPYKIIILDEADAMTTEAQSALRKIMEENSSITRFCFICNYINQIIEPITSRCVKFRFKPLNGTCMINRLNFIANKEQIDITCGAIDTIIKISEGDMRKAIMLLQNLKYTHFKKGIDSDVIYELAGYVPHYIIDEVELICINDKTENILGIVELTNKIRNNGYAIYNIINEINKLIIFCKNICDKMKSKICLHLSMTEKRLLDGGDEYLELLSVFMCIKSIVCNIQTEAYDISI
ncbi:Replication factor C [uncultured virus]|nr:Replication factor C [uncultured virus]